MVIPDFTGPVHLPDAGAYDEARLAWNRAVDPRPALVAEAAGERDVRAAVSFARERGMPLAVQATGHGMLVANEGALLLKTSRLTGVRVDPQRREATAGAGALWTDVIAAAAPYGLAPLSGTPWIGVTGYTLGGGLGWLSRRYGLAADSLLRARVVTADGELRTAEDGDLLWALRGGSGNFGVVTELTFRLYPVERVHAGLTLHPIERTAETLAVYRDWALEEPDTLATGVLLMRMPDGSRVLGVRSFAVEGGERALGPLLAAAGEPLSGGRGEQTFAEASATLAPVHPPMPVRHRFELFRELPDDLVTLLAHSPPDVVEIRHWGGAFARPGGPAGHRDVPFSILTAGDVELPHATGGSFLTFLTDPARTADAYTAANHARLVELKKSWDPDTVFRPSHLIGA
ncbi:FAD-binding oxidoreductase [Thermoactinospora rubra]|uniref:FAD-binding oxidoreductase n=1 Tax=Thermoactinospora rubra TaxID=1088767 RepID=UPI001F0A2A6C|nr:FAD-dependent oxidoreductase [Thermoactinospora rubra]